MRELVSKQIDEHIYQFQQFNTTTALKNLSIVTQLIGEPIMVALAALFKNAPKPKPGETLKDLLKKNPVAALNVNPDALADAAKALVLRLEDDGTDRALKLIQVLTSGPGVLCDNKPVIFDVHYEGRLAHLGKVIAAAFEVQYGNFLGAVTEKAPARPAAQTPIGVR